MNGFLFDTNLISNVVKGKRANAGVPKWLSGVAEQQKPVLTGGHESNFAINLATQSYGEAFTDTMLRLYRASAESYSREEVSNTLDQFGGYSPEAENERQRWLLH